MCVCTSGIGVSSPSCSNCPCKSCPTCEQVSAVGFGWRVQNAIQSLFSCSNFQRKAVLSCKVKSCTSALCLSTGSRRWSWHNAVRGGGPSRLRDPASHSTSTPTQYPKLIPLMRASPRSHFFGNFFLNTRHRDSRNPSLMLDLMDGLDQ